MYYSEIENKLQFNNEFAANPARIPPKTKVGRLTVVQYIGHVPVKDGNRPIHYYECTCACGNSNRLAFSENSLKRCMRGERLTISCGCARKDNIVHTGRTMDRTALIKNKYRPDSPVIKLYYRIRAVCYTPTQKTYKNYGGKGIQLCEEWNGKQGANNFCDWAMSNGYQDGYTIGRRDNDKDFSPSNCYITPRYKTKPFQFTFSGNTNFLKEM